MRDRITAWLRHLRTDTPSEERRQADVQARSDSELEIARDLVVAELHAAETRFWNQWDTEADLAGAIEALRTWHGWRTVLTRLERVEEADGFTIYVDSFVLQDCYQALFAEPDTESICLLTGQVLAGNVRTLNRCFELDHAVQSVAGAEADPDSSFETLLGLEANGHQLLGHGHNHPGTGIASTRPSTDDRAHQHQLEATGYDAVGLIMTRDGYVRFFGNDLAFTPTVYGNHVRHEQEHVFRLEDPIRTAGNRRAIA